MNILLYLLFLHWIGDFVLQTRWMAENKSKRNLALGIHIGVYSLTFIIGLLGHDPYKIAIFVACNALCHFMIDYFTSRANAKLLTYENKHLFWGMLGLDQYAHSATLLLTSVIL